MKNTYLSIRLSKDRKRQIEIKSREKKISSSKLCNQIIEEYFNTDKNELRKKELSTIIERLLRLELFFRKNFERNKDLTDAETKQINESISYLIEKIY